MDLYLFNKTKNPHVKKLITITKHFAKQYDNNISNNNNIIIIVIIIIIVNK